MCIKKKKNQPKDDIASQLEKNDMFSMHVAAFLTIFLPVTGILLGLVLFALLIFGVFF